MSRRRSGVAATLLATGLLLASVVPASATIHEMVASFCSGGNGNVFPPGQSDFLKRSFLRGMQAAGVVTVLPDTPTAGAITIDFNNDAPAGKFHGEDVYVEAIPGLVYVELLEPDHPAFENCEKFTFE